MIASSVILLGVVLAAFVLGRCWRKPPPRPVGGRGGVPEIQEETTGSRKKTRRTFAVATVLAALFFVPLVVVSPAEAALSTTMRGIFDGALSDFVTGILSDADNSLYIWAWMVFLTCSVILIVAEVSKFIFNGIDPVSHITAIFFFFVTLGLMESYDGFTGAIWNAGIGIGNGYQEYLVGNTDNFFLVQWAMKALGAVVLEELSIFDSIRIVLYGINWIILSGLIEVVMWLAALWAHFGYALAKIVGLVFIPFLLLPQTRPLFDSWFKFFCGFVVLTIILKATSAVVAISIKATLEGIGVQFDGDFGDPTTLVEIGKEELYILSDVNAMLLIAILFILSSFVFAGMLANGVGNVSGSLGQAANMVARKIGGRIR